MQLKHPKMLIVHKKSWGVFYLSKSAQKNRQAVSKQSKREGHGFGTKSMSMIAEKYNGYCSFEKTEDIFILRIVLPL
ncbi:MAG: GHKL domain-containing protein [Acetivibrionales bacterium]|jgi:hypothetical protein